MLGVSMIGGAIIASIRYRDGMRSASVAPRGNTPSETLKALQRNRNGCSACSDRCELPWGCESGGRRLPQAVGRKSRITAVVHHSVDANCLTQEAASARSSSLATCRRQTEKCTGCGIRHEMVLVRPPTTEVGDIDDLVSGTNSFWLQNHCADRRSIGQLDRVDLQLAGLLWEQDIE